MRTSPSKSYFKKNMESNVSNSKKIAGKIYDV
jgi:hypothetical protein